jgi:hypothetical protein
MDLSLESVAVLILQRYWQNWPVGARAWQVPEDAANDRTRNQVLIALAPSPVGPKTAPYVALYLRAIEAVAPSIAVKLTSSLVHDETEIEAVLAQYSREKGTGLILPPDVFTQFHRKLIIELAARFALPAIYPFRYYVVDGGLMSYGIDQVEQMRGAAGYVIES